MLCVYARHVQRNSKILVSFVFLRGLAKRYSDAFVDKEWSRVKRIAMWGPVGSLLGRCPLSKAFRVALPRHDFLWVC